MQRQPSKESQPQSENHCRIYKPSLASVHRPNPQPNNETDKTGRRRDAASPVSNANPKQHARGAVSLPSFENPAEKEVEGGSIEQRHLMGVGEVAKRD